MVPPQISRRTLQGIAFENQDDAGDEAAFFEIAVFWKVMSQIKHCLALGALSLLTSCSCGIFRDEFVPTKGTSLTGAEVRQVAIRNHFSATGTEGSAMRFQNRDIELLYEAANQQFILRSSFCPGFFRRFDSRDWQSRCEAMSDKITHDLQELGQPVHKLSSDEAIRRALHE